MSLPLQGSIHISIENFPQEEDVDGRTVSASGAYTCVARLGGSTEVARSSNATRATAFDAVISALRAHRLGDLTLLPMQVSTGGQLPSPKNI